MKTIIPIALAVCLLLPGCASMEGSIGLGAGIGGATGAITGHAINFNMKGMALTTATGAALGALVGYIIHRASQKKGIPPPLKPEVPPIIPEPILQDAEKEVLWVPGRVESDRYTESHRVFIIKRPSRWSPPDEKSEVKNGK